MSGFLDDIAAPDWSDFAAAAEQTQSVLRRLAADHDYLRSLVDRVPNTPGLFAKCERHELDDKIVLYDAMESRGFRIRLRLATAYQDERPHTHRFPFSTYILRGNYHQRIYSSATPLTDTVDMTGIRPLFVRTEPAGSAFTIHDNVIHSTMAPPDTISLILRGPATKTRAIIMHPDRGAVSWRYGEQQEPPSRRAEVAMGIDVFREWRERLHACQIL